MGKKYLEIFLVLHRGEESAVDQGWDDVAGFQSGVGEHGAILGRAVRPALRQREERCRVERDRERTAQVVVQEDVVDDQAAGGWEGCGAAVDELLALGDVPAVEDVGEEDQVAVTGPVVCQPVAWETLETG